MKHLLNSLAVWRLLYLIQEEDAPFEAMKKFRDHVVIKWNYSDGLSQKIYAEIGKAIECKWCLSVWLGFFVALATKENILYGFAYSAMALFISWLVDSSETIKQVILKKAYSLW